MGGATRIIDNDVKPQTDSLGCQIMRIIILQREGRHPRTDNPAHIPSHHPEVDIGGNDTVRHDRRTKLTYVIV